MKLKKFLALLLALLLAFSLVACGSLDDEDDEDDDSDEKKSSVSDSRREEDEEQSDNDGTITEEGKEIFNEEGISVTYEGIKKDSLFGDSLSFNVTNENEETLFISSNYLSLNGFMLFGLFGGEIKGGETEEMTMSLSATDLELYEIEELKTVEFFLEITDEEYKSLAKSDRIRLTLSKNTDAEKDFSKNAKLLSEKNGIKIYAIPEVNANGILGPEAYLYVENDSNKTVTVTDNAGVKINGQETTFFFISDVFPGAKALVDITCYEEELEEKNITEIKTLDTDIQVHDANTFETIFKTGDITIEY